MSEIKTDYSIRFETVSSVNYSLLINNMTVIRFVEITNHSESPLENVTLVVSSDSSFSVHAQKNIDYIAPGDTLCISDLVPEFDPSVLASLSEKQTIVLSFILEKNQEILCEEKGSITILTLDEWSGSGLFPELLAAFSTPNAAGTNTILSRASVLLQQWTGDPSLDAYQTNDPNRVLKQAAAIYNAIREQNIAYCVAPAGFETTGQRIRPVDVVLEQKLGNCLDMSMLYCSCLEAAGLHPIVVVFNSHAFAGVWLEDRNFPESIRYDASLISKRLADGINEISIIECTAMNAGNDATYENAASAAEKKLTDSEDLDFILDIKRSRMSGITPLPLRIKTDSGIEILRENLEPDNSAAQPEAVYNGVIKTNDEPVEFSRKVLWERKLLDLGLRNQLINLRMSKTLVPLLSSSLDTLEDTLSDGLEFSIFARPEDFHITDKDVSFDHIHELITNREFIDNEFKCHRLRSALNENDLAKTVKELYRTSKTSLEENGANTLYMAFGLLKWYENEKSIKARYAPLVLIPIEMVRKSAAGGYCIRLRDDEPQMNITILEKIKADFGIQINGLDPLPLDEHGIDLKSVFTVIRKEIMEMPHWDLLESAYIGIFTFSQFVMWNDIRNRSAELERNKIVRSLVDGCLSWDAEPMVIDGDLDVDDVLLPISADASQAFAIKEAAEGKSFVLHGPPGTGKSQTITALIANALARGKRVLFVAEKMAALSVVEKRLSKLGIGDFCLELHSNKSRKRDVLDQLGKACNVTRDTAPEEFKRDSAKLSKMRSELDRYVKALHHKQPCGLSCYDFISIYEDNIKAPSPISLKGADFINLTPTEYDDLKEAVNSMISAGSALGHPSVHPLRRIRTSEYSRSLRDNLPAAAGEYSDKLSSACGAITDFTRATEVSYNESTSDMRKYAEVIRLLNELSAFPSEFMTASDPDAYFTRLKLLCDKENSLIRSRDNLMKNWKESFLTIDAESTLTAYREALGSFFIFKSIKLNSVVKQLSPCSKASVNKDTLADDLNGLIQYKALKSEADSEAATYTVALSKLPHTTAEDWKKINADADKALNIIKRLDSAFGNSSLRNRALTPELKNVILKAVSALNDMDTASKTFYGLTHATVPGDSEIFSVSENELCKNICENIDYIKDITLWNSACEKVKAFRLDELVKTYEDGLEHELVMPVCMKALSNAVISHICDNSDVLSAFSDADFNAKIKRFGELDARVMELTKKEIYAILASKVPVFQSAGAQSSEIGILQRAIKSNGRGTSIRKLFSQIPNLLPRLTPCMLMSPLSAAQYLDPATELFDLVVFDEASQLPTAKAVGAIARGRDTVIVGDPNQMPPTSFFMTESLDEDNLDCEDLESILDDCLALELPQTHLLWHYRSRHESLIAFSNSRFYDNRLYTFPSANDMESKVSFVHVDGFFDRGKTRQNHAEAKAIVEEIRKRCYDDSQNTFSLGVVTFNISQSNLIDDLITEACSKDPVLDNWLNNQEEPLFIKNLENVQGDERDVILFSVGYGSDKDGKVYMNFGPLNRDGGWRRLNVAVSRARCEMKVFSSLEPEQINLSKTSSQGVAALKNFLEYAKTGTLKENASMSSSKKHNNEGVVKSICEELEKAGYKTKTGIGHSAFRIDIGVCDSENSGRYLAGILLDGEVYASSQLTRDRDLSQKSVLEGLGWNILRVWSISWWDNQKRELENILKFLKNIQSGEIKPIATGTNVGRPVTANEPASASSLSEGQNTVSDSAASSSSCDGASDALSDSATLLSPDVSSVKEHNLSNQAEETPAPEKTPVRQTSAQKAAASGQASSVDTSPSGIQKLCYEPCVLPENILTTEDFLKAANNSLIKKKIETLVNGSAPVSRAYVEKTVLNSFGFTRPGNKVVEKVNSLIDSLAFTGTPQGEDTMLWSKKITPETLSFFRVSDAKNKNRRDIREIAIQELELAAVYVVENQISLSSDDLIKEVAKLFGYTRTGENITNFVAAAIKFALIDDRLKIDINGKITLK